LGFGWVARKRCERRSKYYSIERSAQKHLGNMCLINSLIETNLSIVSDNCTLRKVFFDKKLLINDENDH